MNILGIASPSLPLNILDARTMSTPIVHRPSNCPLGIKTTIRLCLFFLAVTTCREASPAFADERATATVTEPALCYRWKDGQQYYYRISCKVTIGNTVLEVTGGNTYTWGRSPVESAFADSPESKQGTGSAFVVSDDGYLLTCEHVVRNATSVKVAFGDQTATARIVATDATHDLAILRVERQNLVALPLADSDAIELAENVRAVGFPLSDVLGDSIKVTQGSVAGIVTKAKGKMLQIDAVVNPGNSGGPLLDDGGAVVGVVSAQLLGSHVSKVGFAVPINYAKALLTKHRITFQTDTAGDKLDGPTLAKRVGPSVALVTVLGHDGDTSATEQPVLRFHGMLEHRKRARSAADKANASVPVDSSDRDDGSLTVDDYGDISRNTGHIHLPCLLGPLGAVAVDHLSTDGQKTWEHQEVVMITASGRASDDPLAGVRPPGFTRQNSPPPFGPFDRWAEADTRCPATLKAKYSILERHEPTVLIRKRLEIKTIDRAEPEVKVQLIGSGETHFDLVDGVPQKTTFSGKFTMRENGQTIEAPVVLVCERTEQGEPKHTSPTTSVVGDAENLDLTNARLDSLLADLNAAERNWGKCFRALEELSIMKLMDDRRDETSRTLDNYLAEKNYSARLSALRAIRIWGTPQNVPSLVRLLDPSENDIIRQRAIEALGSIGDPQAAEPLAERLADPADRASAIKALCDLGPAAEDAVVSMLADKDPAVYDAACKVLGEIGGSKAIAAMKRSATTEGRIRNSTKSALEKLQKKH